jgi:hypothetical protein
MNSRFAVGLAAVVLLAGAAGASRVQAEGPASSAQYSYEREIKPILEKHCIMCHACYDAPCQLKMESPEGFARGATKAVVYKARPKAQAPTRLHIDASSTESWRQKGFFSVLDGGKDSLLSRMLELGKRNAPKANERIPDEVQLGPKRENQCPTAEEFKTYEHRRMHEGMPFGLAPLRPEILYALQGWVSAGAPLDEAETLPSGQTMAVITAWEQFLNASDNRSQLLARYFYEHLFLAHLHFDATATAGFFELVRSSTPPGSPIELIATRRPTDDPGSACYYRLRPVRGSIVQKTHIIYPFGLDKLEHLRTVFGQVKWDVAELPGYTLETATNPFKTYAAIPARLRYQFLLDNAYYFVQCFIRGPVCLGNIATDVIQDHFYNMYQKPESDLFCTDATYEAKVREYLGVRGREGMILDVRPDWMASEQRYGKLRNARYKTAARAASPKDIWNGAGTNPDAMMTVFRNFDSATVVRGLRGQTPKTIWVMDYPIFERTYYLLVVNFDVFGSAAHQVETRLYFDLLRAEAETNFLRFMPKEVRSSLRKSWYRGTLATLKTLTVYPSLDDTATQFQPKGDDPVADFVSQLRVRMPTLAGPEGDLTGNSFPVLDKSLDASMQQSVEASLRTLEGGNGAERPFIKFLPDVSFIRVGFGDRTQDLSYSLSRVRSHTNVAFMFREEARLEPDKDYTVLLRGPVGCYPNFIFQVPLAKVNDFVEALGAVTDQESFTAVVHDFGVGRTHPWFYEAFDFFREYMDRINPVERGIFDANRYANY